MLIHLFTRWSVDVQSRSLSKPYIFRRLRSRNSTGSSALLRRNYSDVLPLGVWSSGSQGAHSVRHPLVTTHGTCSFTVKHTSFCACLTILAHSSIGTAAFSCPRKSSAEENLGALLEDPKFNKKKIQCGASNPRPALHVLSICVQNKLVNHSSLLPFLPWPWVYIFSPVNCQVKDSQGAYILRGRKCQE